MKEKETKTIKADYADTYTKRLKGLMLQNTIKPLLYKQKNPHKIYATIHTLFMKKTIDIIYINQKNQITETTTLKPWKIHIPKNNDTKYIIELPQNTIKTMNIKKHNQTKITTHKNKKIIKIQTEEKK
ncbi:MAG: hypothetical protein BZ136_05105 [Methanosphaera sp. rholeuAM74]|nr:MAG: hypothetical protein BZ136_05105 [Methanosphaera sp. rholeuAM74]